MKKSQLLLSLLVFFYANAFSQSPSLDSVLLIPENATFQTTQLEVMGMKEQESGNTLFYKFIHPNGGIQKSAGAFFSGGGDSENLPAFSSVFIPDDGVPAPGEIRWIAPRGQNTKANFYAKPLVETQDMTQTPLATPDNLLPFEELGNTQRSLAIPKKPTSIQEEKTEDAPGYVQKYYKTLIYAGMSGGLTQVATLTYTLKPEEDWNKGLDPSPYGSKTDIFKDGVKEAFSDSKISYKGFSSRKMNDPLSGNAVILGGLKYKKNDEKENSEFFEFKLIAFDKEGNIINSAMYESESPLRFQEVFPIYGANIAPDIKEVTHAVFVAYGDGDRKMENINPKLRLIITVDLKTGQIVNTNEAELVQDNGILFECRQTQGTGFSLGFYYPTEDNKGFTFLNVDKEGNLSRQDYSSSDPEAENVSLPADRFMRLTTKTINTFQTTDGNTIVLKNFLRVTGSETSSDYKESPLTTCAFFEYDAEGRLVSFKLNNKLREINDYALLARKGDLLIYLIEKPLWTTTNIAFTTINLETFEVNLTTPPNDFSLAGPGTYYQDVEKESIYFLNKGKDNKGLYLFQYKY